MSADNVAAKSMVELLSIMRRLRDPETGCPWDMEQNFETIAPYTLEEAYEVVDAIQRGLPVDLCEELGDLLFQVVYHAQMASERDWFDFGQVVDAINAKLLRRHPHVFGDETITTAAQQSEAWEKHKADEKAARNSEPESLLDNIPQALPAVIRAQKIQARAARAGFDWQTMDGVIDKLQEELDELKAARLSGESSERLREELGDLMFSCVNMARHLGTDAELLLRLSNVKFEERFRTMEALHADKGRLEELSGDELESLWHLAKQQTRQA